MVICFNIDMKHIATKQTKRTKNETSLAILINKLGFSFPSFSTSSWCDHFHIVIFSLRWFCGDKWNILVLLLALLSDLFSFVSVTWPSSRVQNKPSQSRTRRQSCTDKQEEQHNSRPEDSDCDTLTEAWRCLTGGSREPAVTARGRGSEEGGVILPYRRLGGDISSPNLVEGTCREASRTYRGKSCGRFPGGKDGRSPWKEGWWFPRWGGVGFKRGRGSYIITESGKIQKRRWEGRGKERKTQKSLLIRFPGYHDLECHLSWI